jgi:hypothetical protein
MSREINVKDPDSWNDDDLEYLRQRPHLVGEEHRDRLNPVVTLPPASEAESTEIARLRAFLETAFPEEIGVDGETPVGCAIRLLSEDVPDENDEYDSMKVAELRDEVRSRQANGRLTDVDASKVTKADAITALRADDGA